MAAVLRILAVGVLALATAPVWAVTDCSRPKTSIDWLLCSNDKAALADNIMAAAFRDAFRRTDDKDALIQDQERWKREVRDACNDIPCLMRAFQDRTSELETW